MGYRSIALVIAVTVSACASPAPRHALAEAAPSDAIAHCPEAGTNLRPRPVHGCLSSPAQVFSREDLARTGSVGTVDALRRLTPIFR